MKRQHTYQRTAPFVFLLVGVCVLTAFGTAQAPAVISDDRAMEAFSMLNDPEDFWESVTDRLARRQYAEEGAEIIPWTRALALPSADNAALLYYQAFLLLPEPDSTTNELIYAVLRDGAPNDMIRAYLGRCREAIHTAELASQIPQCVWGLQHADSAWSAMPFFSHIRSLIFVLAVDARTLVTDGHDRAALVRCLMLRRLARHIGSDTELPWLMSLAADGIAADAIQHVLGVMSPDSETFSWFRGQLAAVPGPPASLSRTLENGLELTLEILRADALFLDEIRRLAAEADDSDGTRADLTDEELIALIRKPHAEFLSDAGRIMDSEMDYGQKYKAIEELMSQLKAESDNDPLLHTVFIALRPDSLSQLFNLRVRNESRFNALKAALDVYLIKADAGQLPETLPAFAPKDPFSGQDFVYEITAEGFVLRCQGRDLQEDTIWEYEFPVHD